jgi:hypothetical protein
MAIHFIVLYCIVIELYRTSGQIASRQIDRSTTKHRDKLFVQSVTLCQLI